MKKRIEINNVSAAEVDKVVAQLKALGYNPVIKVPESDGEFTVIAYMDAITTAQAK